MSKSFIFAALAALIWGFAPAFEKLGLDGKIDPYLGVVIRSIPVAVIAFIGSRSWAGRRLSRRSM